MTDKSKRYGGVTRSGESAWGVREDVGYGDPTNKQHGAITLLDPQLCSWYYKPVR